MTGTSWRRGLRITIVLSSFAVLVALVPVPVLSQGDQPDARIREGVWIGEGVVFGRLRASVDGGAADWGGSLNLQSAFDVDSEEVFTGDWVLSGQAEMAVYGTEAILFFQDYFGSGTYQQEEDPSVGYATLNLSGEVTTTGTATTSLGELSVPPVEAPFETSADIVGFDCYEMRGTWTVQLDQLAQAEGWQARDLNGYFYASFLGDEVDSTTLRDIDRLWSDIKEWSDTMLDSEVVDVDTAFALITRARTISVARAEAEGCDPGTRGESDRYLTAFTSGMLLGLYETVVGRTLDGLAVRNIVTVGGALGQPGVFTNVEASIGIDFAVREQAQRIVEANTNSGSENCAPCVFVGSEADVVNAAIAGKMLGQEFEIDGKTFSPDDVIRAATGT